MKECYFQDTRTDLFQEDFLPGRPIPELLSPLSFSMFENNSDKSRNFNLDDTNKSAWITVIYQSVYYAEKALKELPRLGLKVYYPKTRITTTNFSTGETKDKLVAAYGRYLFIQLPEDDETMENIELDEKLLSGRFNQNGFSSIIVVDGVTCKTQDDEINSNRVFHDIFNKKANPRVALRFRAGELVKVIGGNLEGKFVTVIDDIKMSYRVNTKTEIIIGTSGARHYIQIKNLEKIVRKSASGA